MKFLIYIPFFTPVCGGVVVLARLCQLMNKLGYETYSTINVNYNDIYSPSITQEQADDYNTNRDNWTVIYPEQVSGNPFGAKNVIRWILFTPDETKGHGAVGAYSPSDYIFKFSSNYTINQIYQTSGFLTLYYLDTNLFKNNKLDRSGSCYVIKKDIYKSSRKVLQHDLSNSIQIDGLTLEQKADIFNTTETFYSYDACCFYSFLAGICGCTSVVFPDEKVPKEQWTNGLEIMKYGVAYGLDDIKWAKNTQHLMMENYESLKSKTELQVHEMVNIIRRGK